MNISPYLPFSIFLYRFLLELVLSDKLLLRRLGSHLSSDISFYVISLSIPLGIEIVCPVLETGGPPFKVVFRPLRLATRLSFCLRLCPGAWTCLQQSHIWSLLHARVVFRPWNWPILLFLSYCPYPFRLLRGQITIWIKRVSVVENKKGKLLSVFSLLLIDPRLLNLQLWTKVLCLQNGKFFSPHSLHLSLLPSGHTITSMWVCACQIEFMLTTVSARRCDSTSRKLRRITTKNNTS